MHSIEMKGHSTRAWYEYKIILARVGGGEEKEKHTSGLSAADEIPKNA